jgi:hypothetical protein
MALIVFIYIVSYTFFLSCLNFMIKMSYLIMLKYFLARMSSSTYYCADFLCNDFDRRWPQKQCLWQKLNSLLCNEKAGTLTTRPRLVRLLNLTPGSSTLSYSQFTLEDSRNNLILTLWQIDFLAEACPQRKIPSFLCMDPVSCRPCSVLAYSIRKISGIWWSS